MAHQQQGRSDAPPWPGDRVQLAAAQERHLTTAVPLTFASYDRRLNQAAQLLQLEVLS